MDFLGEASIFFALDLSNRSWQAEIKNEDKNETAFIIHRDQISFVQMLFDI